MRLGSAPALALSLGALLLPAAVPAAAVADVAQVRVVSPGGSEQTLALDALAGSEDVVGRVYALRSGGGESTLAVTGFSLARILDAAGADPYGFSYLEVQRPAGGAVLLSRDQALGAGADGPPVVYATAAGTGFLRPGGGPDDRNANDSFDAPQGVSIVLRKGSRLQVRAKASSPRTRPGQPVHFSAVVAGAGAGEELTCSWYFDDGASAAGTEATHSFDKRGSYDVVVGVTSAGDAVGASAVVTIQVGPPLSGPDRRGGGESRATDATDHGAANGPGSGTGSSLDPAGGQVGHTPPDTRPPAASSVRRGTPDRPGSESRPQAPRGTLVAGELVSAEVESDSSPRQQAPARRGRLDSDGGGIPGVVWGLLAAVGLLGLGGVIEARSPFR